MGQIRVVVFDLDDTLYPERQYAFSGFAAVARAFAEKLGDAARAEADMRRLFDTQHRPRVFDALLAERGLGDDPALINRMVEVYRSHSPRIQLYADADAALSRLQMGYKLGLITDGRAAAQWAKIDALDLRLRFHEIIVTSELDPPADGGEVGGLRAEANPSRFAKPHPRAFEWIANRLDIAARECGYVADNPAKDFVAPNLLGWLTIQVYRRDGIHRHATIAPGGQARHCVESLNAVDSLLSWSTT